MFSYIIRRILLMVPTLFGIMVINFIVIQFAPGGPVEKVIAQFQGLDSDVTAPAVDQSSPAFTPQG